MNFKKFEEQLAKGGSSLEEYEETVCFCKGWIELAARKRDVALKLIDMGSNFNSVINLSFVLSQTSQGAEYWLDVMTGASDD